MMDRELFEHFLADSTRIGPAPDDAFTGAAGGAACGDLARISLSLDDGRVAAVTFDSEGCGATRAATAAVAEAVEGAEVLEAARLSVDEIESMIGGLTPATRHAAVLAADALHRALSLAASSGVSLAPTPQSGRDPADLTAQGVGGIPPQNPAPSTPPQNARVAIALSGGVDSAVAALLEREAGNDVIAVTVKLWADPETDGTKACCSPEAVLGARAVAHSLGIPHFTLDLEQEFRARVVDRFVQGYAEGRTPNPCVLCNGEVRITAMLALAERAGAQRLLTGHYARIVEDDQGPLLASGADAAKDQAYMLAALPTDLIGRLGFPLTEMTKDEVRAVATRHGLSVAKKPESQDLCFLAGQGKRGFLRRHGGLVDRPGDVVDGTGRALGRHRGHHNFTVGQRRGHGVSLNEPAYVIATDAAANTVTIGTREELVTRRIHVRDAVLHRDGDRVDAVRLRYHSRALPARLEPVAVPAGHAAPDRFGPGRHDALEIALGEEFAGASPGQTAVLLDGETVIGHGTIATPIAPS
jgi:tRNA-uridine 2-sulfurtransferase